ncbi:hypothetical protein TNCV_1181901 [Trichonephila clavipes]|nr:hypothetical protein TNCV_1181901 [Trichonephila clavipes]
MCSLPPSPRGSTIAQPKIYVTIKSIFQQSNKSAQIPSSSSLTSSNNNTVKTTNLNNNNNRNSISGRSTTTKTTNNLSKNCIRTQTNRRELIPVIIDNDTEIQVLCDSWADSTVIQQSCIPNNIVINPWTDGQFKVHHEIKPIGWISLNLIVGNVEHI